MLAALKSGPRRTGCPRRKHLVTVSLILLGAACVHASTLLTFEGLPNGADVDGFYNGGDGGNLGINFVFPNRFQALISRDAGGTGVFSGEPSPSTVVRILPGTTTVSQIVVSGGFDS